MARPSKLNPEVADRVADLVAAGLTLTETAQRVGVARRTLMAWLARGLAEPGTPHGDLHQRVQIARARAGVRAFSQRRAADTAHFSDAVGRTSAFPLLVDLGARSFSDWRDYQRERQIPRTRDSEVGKTRPEP